MQCNQTVVDPGQFAFGRGTDQNCEGFSTLASG